MEGVKQYNTTSGRSGIVVCRYSSHINNPHFRKALILFLVAASDEGVCQCGGTKETAGDISDMKSYAV